MGVSKRITPTLTLCGRLFGKTSPLASIKKRKKSKEEIRRERERDRERGRGREKRQIKTNKINKVQLLMQMFTFHLIIPYLYIYFSIYLRFYLHVKHLLFADAQKPKTLACL